MTWTVPAPDPSVETTSGPERPMLESLLRWHRHTLVSICAGLTDEQLALRPVPSSRLSLLGLLRHLAKVERTWLRQRVAGLDVGPLFDPALGRKADFEDIRVEDAAGAFERWRDECAAGDEAVRDVPLDHVVEMHGDSMSVRMIYLHLIQEYARHNGHADLLREAIDGVTGR